MSSLQEIGRLLVESKTREALEALKAWARDFLPEKVTEIELQLSRVSLDQQLFTRGLKTLAEHQAEVININNAVIHLIDECRQAQESTAATGGSLTAAVALHEYHAYTCDRIDHSDYFQQQLSSTSNRAYFFFLYGGDLQSHEGFFRRSAYFLEGRLTDYLNPTLSSTREVLQLEMTFEFSRQLDLYKQNILRSFFAMLNVPPNEHEPLLQRDLCYVTQQSPRIKGLTAEDYVCVFLHVSQYDWDAQLTPAAARWFISEFCANDLPANLPQFHFFFAVEYDEEDEVIREEVLAAIAASEKIGAIPELNMVQQRDIAQWLERYKQLAPSGRDRKDLLQQHFGSNNEHYMEDVQLSLKKIIDHYNNRIVR